MAVVEKHVETICGWTLDKVIDRVNQLGADHRNVAIEPVSLGGSWNYVSVPAIVWYERESDT